MPRRSDTHSGRLDDEMKHEVGSILTGSPSESHVEEFREQEGAADDEAVPDARITSSDVEARSELARRLRGSAFPADRETLLTVAREEQAPQHILDDLDRL